MNFRLKTRVNGYYEDVMRHFDQELFEALLPKFGRVKIVAFTGSKTGDRVHLRFLSPVRFDWISDITEDGKDHEKAWFVDESAMKIINVHFTCLLTCKSICQKH